MKKFTALLLAVLLLLQGTACSTMKLGGGKADKDGEAEADDAPAERFGSTFYNLVDPDKLDPATTAPYPDAGSVTPAWVDDPQPALTPLPDLTGVEPYVDDYGLIIDGVRVMEQYGAGENGAKSYAKLINQFVKNVGDGSVNFYSMPIPLASGTYAPEDYPRSIAAHEKAFAGLRDSLAGITDVNLLPVFQAHKNQKLYSYTDHHWHALGAFYAAEALCKAAGVEFASLGYYKKVAHPGYIGTLYRYVKHREIFKTFTEDFITFEPRAAYTARFYDQNMNFVTEHDLFFDVWDTYPTNWYGTYISGDSYAAEIHSEECKNGRSLLLIKDSYGNALAPYFLSSFETVYLIDVRYFNTSAVQLVKDRGVTDVCFALCAFSIVGDNGQNMANLL